MKRKVVVFFFHSEPIFSHPDKLKGLSCKKKKRKRNQTFTRDTDSEYKLFSQEVVGRGVTLNPLNKTSLKVIKPLTVMECLVTNTDCIERRSVDPISLRGKDENER